MLQGALRNAETRISELSTQIDVLRKEASEHQAKENRLLEEANMLRKAVQVTDGTTSVIFSSISSYNNSPIKNLLVASSSRHTL